MKLPSLKLGMHGRLSPIGIALLYAVFAGLWIIASGYLLTFTVDDPLLQSRIETAKGLVFVAVTAGLLYLLLKGGQASLNAATTEPAGDIAALKTSRLVLLLVALALVVPLIGLAIVKLHGPQIEREAYDDLQAIARLKSDQIENWLAERHGDSISLAADAGFAAQVNQFVQRPHDANLSKLVLARFDVLRKSYGYDSILLLDSSGKTLLILGTEDDDTPALQQQVHQTLSNSLVQLGDLYRDDTGKIHLDWVVPISGPQGQGPVAVAVLRVTAQHFLFPLIQTWPTASPSAETLLVRRAGESVLYLNELRHLKAEPLTLRRSLADPELPAAIALRARKADTTPGKDYRGVSVLAAYRPVAGTDWSIVAKIDQAEVLAPLRELILWVSLVAFSAIVALSAALLLLWRQQQRMQGLALLAEKAKADQLLRQFFDLPFIGMTLSSPTTKHWIQFNQHLCTIFGYSGEELANKTWAEMTHPDDIETDVAEFERVMRGESDGYTLDKRFIRKDGAVVFTTLNVKCVRKPDGTVDFFIGMIQDITQRKLAEETLRASELRYSSLFESMLNGFAYCRMEYDDHGRPADFVYLDVNNAFEQITGLKNVVGKPVSEVIPGISELSPEMFDIFDRVAATGIPKTFDFDFKSQSKWLTISVYSPKKGEFVAVFDDITERKQLVLKLAANETRLRTLVQTIPDLIWLKDAQGIYLSCNPIFERFFGAKEADIIGKTDYDFVDKELADFFRAHDRIAMAAGKPSSNEEWLTLPDDGHRGLFETIKTPMIDAQGKLIGVLGIARDITERKQAEETLAKSEARYRLLFAANPIPMWVYDINTLSFIAVNDAAIMHYGYTHEEFLGMTIADIRPTADVSRLKETIDHVAAESNIYSDSGIWQHRTKDGALIWVEITGHTLNFDGRDAKIILAHDVTARIAAEQELRIAATAFETQESIVITDTDKVILRVNHAFSHMTGYSAEEVIGQRPSLLKSGRQDDQFYLNMWDSINRNKSWQGEIWNRYKNGEVHPGWLAITAATNATGQVTNYIGTYYDLTQSKEADDNIRRLAFYDPLTGLPNRRLLHDRLQQSLVASARHHSHGAILFIDLDNFKTLNDTKGHNIGDLLLIEVASRLQACVRERDTVARLSGDEFIIMLEELSEDNEQAATQTEAVGDKILAAISRPYLLEGYEHHCSASIGISLYRNQEITADELLKRADTAMYEAKNAGRNALRFYDPAVQMALEARTALESDLRRALAADQFRLYYQMQVDHSGHIHGAEALIRWQHPGRGLISPLDFILLAEETGMILPIGQWVLEAACAQLQAWETDPLTRELQLAVNVSARQFRQPDFVEQVHQTLRNHTFNTNRLKLELTESMVLDNIHDTIGKMQALRKDGVRFSMDDFGTGYSSLSYLTQLPLDQLKIDQSFVRNIGVKHNNAVIVQTIIGMANNLGIEVIAEGVETEEQRAFLEHHGCALCQGYLFSRPVPVEEFEASLKNMT